MAGISGLRIEKDIIDLVDDVFDSKTLTDWVMLALDGDSELKVSYVGEDWFSDPEKNYENDWNDVLDYFPKDGVRYIVVNFKYTSPTDKIERTKKVFVMWAPEEAGQKDKLMITMYSRDVQRQLSKGAGFPICLQANELSDLTYSKVLDKISSTCYCF